MHNLTTIFKNLLYLPPGNLLRQEMSVSNAGVCQKLVSQINVSFC